MSLPLKLFPNNFLKKYGTFEKNLRLNKSS